MRNPYEFSAKELEGFDKERPLESPPLVVNTRQGPDNRRTPPYFLAWHINQSRVKRLPLYDLNVAEDGKSYLWNAVKPIWKEKFPNSTILPNMIGNTICFYLILSRNDKEWDWYKENEDEYIKFLQHYFQQKKPPRWIRSPWPQRRAMETDSDDATDNNLHA